MVVALGVHGYVAPHDEMPSAGRMGEASRTAPIAKFKKLTFPSDTRRYNGHDASTTHAELMKSHSDLA